MGRCENVAWSVGCIVAAVALTRRSGLPSTVCDDEYECYDSNFDSDWIRPEPSTATAPACLPIPAPLSAGQPTKPR